MNILKISTDWAKAEVFSTAFFLYFGVAFLLAALGFWRMGRTDLAKAYVIPLLVAGVLLMIIGAGLVYTNKSRITTFASDYATDPVAFVTAEIERAEATLKEYRTVVFTAIPIIIAAATLVILFLPSPGWRAAGITTIAMLTVILLIDGNAGARMEAYYEQLISIHS
ncbi:hypothetical protein CEQ90_17675 [Lewinellaceae bacterium SD302]|nr:hypothetical protein CEQ90_17675 [Lewinellaceae bacterium SD302]